MPTMVSTNSSPILGMRPSPTQASGAIPLQATNGDLTASALRHRRNRRDHPDRRGRRDHRDNRASAAGTALSNHTTRDRYIPASQPLNMKPDWLSWPELAIHLSFLPRSTTTLHLVAYFSRHGRVVYAEIFQARGNAVTAIVRFSPVPLGPFWQDRMSIEIGAETHHVTAKLLPPKDPEMVTTPGGHSHRARLTLKPMGLQFGLLSQPDQFMAIRSMKNTLNEEFSFLVDLKARKVEITFHCIISDPRRVNPKIKDASQVGERERVSVYKARIPFPHLKQLAVLEDESEFSVVIPLQSPPILFKRGELERSCCEGKSSWAESELWNRAVDVTYDTSWFRDMPVSLRADHHFVDIGRCTTYKLTFKKSNFNVSVWDTMKKALEDFNIATLNMDTSSLQTVAEMKSNFWETLEPKATNLALLAAAGDVHLPFDLRYQLEVCISQGFFDVGDLSPEFLRNLTELSDARTKMRNRAVDLLTYVAVSGGPSPRDESKMYPKRFYDPMALFQDKIATSHYLELDTPRNCTWMRKVVVTPSTMYLSTPTPEPSNRVLRQYAAHADRFLRVQFTDELMKGRIASSPRNTQQDALFNRVHRTLHNGIHIAGRHFEFLAFGNSQFRENGAYFFSPTDYLTCDHIRAWMGDVAHIRVVAKHAARLGQCFSTTRALKNSPIGLRADSIPDIERNGWCFTDGVGKISPKLAEYVAKPLQLKHVPSAFQFRRGGSKGVLVVWPDSNFNEIYLRPSQKKFESQSGDLEIIKASSYSVATLNRQTITILSCLGVDDSVFLDLQQRQIRDYNQAMKDSETAVRLLTRFVDQNGVTTSMAQMIRDGFMQANEPFLLCLLQVWRAWSLRLLREKARIVVEQGAFVLGCVDETCKLRGYRHPGESGPSKGEFPQIFLQVPRPDDPSRYMVVTGLCVVGRNPSLHPGDLRVVEAVDLPALRFLRDVVVFPATGDRDIPSMCSGGDLDGDDFFVIWDRHLIPSEKNYPPMKHEPEKPVELDRDVQTSDLVSFFTDYMKNDSLSTIAHAHLAQSDQLEGGPKHEKCVELAHLHSNAVDYPKSGRPAHLKASLRPRAFPHFMEKPNRSYHSSGILGQLYDVVAKVEFHPNYSENFDERIIRRFALTDEMLKRARVIKRQHDRALQQIMNLREIGTEFEVYTAFVMTKPRVGTEYQIQETMGPIIANHRERFRAACIEAAGSQEVDILYPFVAATYRVTWEAVQMETRKRNGNISNTLDEDQSMPFISFPWIFGQELGRIANLEQDYQLDSLPDIPVADLELDEEDGDLGVSQSNLIDASELHKDLLSLGDSIKLIDVDEYENPHRLRVSVQNLMDMDEPVGGQGSIHPTPQAQEKDIAATGVGTGLDAPKESPGEGPGEEPGEEVVTLGLQLVTLKETETCMDRLEQLYDDSF